MKITKKPFFIKAIAALVGVLSVSSLSLAQPSPADFERDNTQEYREIHGDNSSHKDGGREGKRSSRFEAEHRGKRDRMKHYLESLPMAERESIKAEFKAIRDERMANERRLEALKSRLEVHKKRLGKSMDHEETSKHSDRPIRSKRCLSPENEQCDGAGRKNNDYRHHAKDPKHEHVNE